MAEQERGWQTEVERGPDWLFVRLKPTVAGRRSTAHISGQLWELLEQHFTSRLVLEMESVSQLPSQFIGELLSLQQRLRDRGGILRLCGLSPACREAIGVSALGTQLSSFDSRAEAVWGAPQPMCDQGEPTAVTADSSR